MLLNRRELSEIYFLKHRHDDNRNFVDYESKILDSTLSPYIYENSLMGNWLKRMQPLVAILFDQMNIMKNFKNYIVDKYEYRHNK